jgi:alpha-L-rhamnosidase
MSAGPTSEGRATNGVASGSGPGTDPTSGLVSRRQVLSGGLLLGAGAAVASQLAGCSTGGVPAAGSPPAATGLTTSGLSAPMGLMPDDVVFSWLGGDGGRGTVQRAYRLTVERARPDPGAGTTVWDTGRVISARQAFVTYAGPALLSDATYRWTVRTWGVDGGPGPSAPWASFDTGLRDRDWRAMWVRRPVDHGIDPNEYTYVRRQVNLRRMGIVRARAYVSGGQQYELWVNGVRAGKGQAYSFPDGQYYETLDLTDLLRGGANGVGLLYNWQGPTKGHPAGAAGVIMQVSVRYVDGSTDLVTTDGSWRVRAGAWAAGTQRDLEGDLVDYTEDVDGRAVPVGWDRPGFDDASWAPATVVGPAGTAPWTHLVSVRTRIVETPLRPVALSRLASGSFVADFGKVYAARPSVRFRHGTSGHVVPMHAGYLLDQPVHGQAFAGVPGQVSTTHGTQHTDMSYRYIQRGGEEVFDAFDYLGFRYFQVDDPGEELTAEDFVIYPRHTALPDVAAATFASSEPTVDAVFALGRHSAQYTAQEQYVDTPTREKGPWLWDGFNESQTAMAAFAERNLTRKSLLEFAASQARYWPNGAVNKIYPTGLGALDINEFTEIYPEWVWQYWMHSGDLALLSEVYPVLVNLADYVDRAVIGSTGLVTSLPATNVYYAFPVVTRMNVLGVNVFRRTGAVATALGRPQAERDRQQGRADALTAAVNGRLSRPDGTYADGLDATGVQTPSASQDTNACAVVYGVAPATRWPAIGAFLAGLGMQAPPRTAGEVIRALSLCGRDDDLVQRLTDAGTDGWPRILARGGTFTWEVWEPSDLVGDSMSHGWGSNVLVEIQRALLGVQPAAPGFAVVDVRPPGSGLRRASGSMPTTLGPVTVAWEAPGPGQRATRVSVTVPPNGRAVVHLPARRPGDIREGSTAAVGTAGVTAVEVSNGDAAVHVGSGTYELRTTAPAGPNPSTGTIASASTTATTT